MSTQQRATLRDVIHDADDTIINVGDPMMLVDASQCVNGTVVEIKTIIVVEEHGTRYEFSPKDILVMPF